MAIDQPPPSSEALKPMTHALRGLSAYAAEQQVAMAMTRDGLDLNALWAQKKVTIDQGKGMTFFLDVPGFDAVQEADNAVQFLQSLHQAQEPPGLFVWLDEGEKALAGHSTDTSGVTQDYLGALLTEIQDTDALGAAFLGHPGTGKSWLAQNAGNGTIPVVRFDVNALKGSLVGESEANMRHALRVIRGLGGEKIVWLMTCNAIAHLPEALKRRFNFVFFFDLPGEQGRLALWSQYRSKYGITHKELPDDSQWTGAEIAKCCRIADEFETDLVTASQYIIPIATQNQQGITNLRKEADGRYLSAAQTGVFRLAEEQTTRRMRVE